MKKYWPVWACLFFSAINLPFAMDGNTLNIFSAIFALLCAGINFILVRSLRR